MSEQKPVAYRQHVEYTRNGETTQEFTYYSIQIMQSDDALFTADQLKAERENAIREAASIGYEYHEDDTIGDKILKLLSTNESKEE
ncbi:MAG: hypothetical protein V4440_14765 [Pseudomonadota bacterium]